MAPKHRIIIDTDPGVDDVLALLLALSAAPEELEVVMISVTYGNVPLHGCLRNVVAMFHVLEKEMAWRKSVGKAPWPALTAYKPIVAIGAASPLAEEQLMADYFHGLDGLHGVHETLPHLSPAGEWHSLFEGEAGAAKHGAEPYTSSDYFTPSREPAHKEMLRLLRENPEDTISILAIGPMTNVALAAAEDPAAFVRVKELAVMAGAMDVPGNVTPAAEFNTYADSYAAARVFALTSPDPTSTMPLAPPTSAASSFSSSALLWATLPAYPPADQLPRRLRLTQFPLDIANPHQLRRRGWGAAVAAPSAAGSPLALWVDTFLVRTFDHIDQILGGLAGDEGLSLYDPILVWYILTHDDARWRRSARLEDVRIETVGQWTKGMHVCDRRAKVKPGEVGDGGLGSSQAANGPGGGGGNEEGLAWDEVPGDTMGWLSVRKGNRVSIMVESPPDDILPAELVRRIFG